MWTLLYSGVEKSFSDWGLSNARLNRLGFNGDAFTCVANDQNYDDDPLFTFLSQITIYRDRTAVGSGGTVYFIGWVQNSKRIGSYNSEKIQYSFGNIVWRMRRLIYEQAWPLVTTSHVLMNIVPGYTGTRLNVAGQIGGICDYVKSKLGDIFDYDVTGVPQTFPPTDELRDVTCDEALRSQMKYLPTMTLRCEYQTGRTNLVFANRAGIQTAGRRFTFDVNDGITITSNSIVSLDDLVAPVAIVRYEINSVISGHNVLSITDDTYPAGISNVEGAFRGSVNLTGADIQRQTAHLDSYSFIDPGTGGVAVDWLTEKNPWLLNVQAGSLVIQSTSFTDKTGATIVPYAYELRHDGVYHKWMGGDRQHVVVKVLISYIEATGKIVKDQELTHRIRTVNLAPGDYQRDNVTFPGEPIPGFINFDGSGNPVYNYNPALAGTYGMSFAYTFYQELKDVQHEGEIVVDNNDGEVSADNYAGTVICLTSGQTSWATMDALVQDVQEDLDSGQVTIKFGRNKFLSAGDLLDLVRVLRLRRFTVYMGQMTTGRANPADVQMPDGVAQQDSTKGQATVNKDVITWTDPADPTNTSEFVFDATTNNLSFTTPNGTMTLSMDALNTNNGLN